MRDNPLISVIVPVYNTEQYIKRAIESICRQTYENIEVIIVNDGSTDRTEQVCISLEKRDTRIKYYYQENGGVSSARNLGLEKASGEYILFCDADDEWDSKLVEIVADNMMKNDCDMVRFSYRSDNERYLAECPLPEKKLTARETLVEWFMDADINANMSNCWGGMYKRSIIKQNNITFMKQLRAGEDIIFVFDYTMSCSQVSFISDKLYIYYPVFEDRVNATNRKQAALYDEYELHALKLQKFYKKYHLELTEEQKKDVYGKCYDRIIGRMICFAAYSTTTSKKSDERRLKEFINQPYMIEAGKYFERVRKTDSCLVPFLMRRRWSRMLWWMLNLRAKKYIAAYGKKIYAYSIWREGETRVNE